jgi:hypothetical protein
VKGCRCGAEGLFLDVLTLITLQQGASNYSRTSISGVARRQSLSRLICQLFLLGRESTTSRTIRGTYLSHEGTIVLYDPPNRPGLDYVKLLASVELMLVKAWPIPAPMTLIAVVAPKATRAMTRAYSTRSWPSSRIARLCKPKQSKRILGHILLDTCNFATGLRFSGERMRQQGICSRFSPAQVYA